MPALGGWNCSTSRVKSLIFYFQKQIYVIWDCPVEDMIHRPCSFNNISLSPWFLHAAEIYLFLLVYYKVQSLCSVTEASHCFFVSWTWPNFQVCQAKSSIKEACRSLPRFAGFSHQSSLYARVPWGKDEIWIKHSLLALFTCLMFFSKPNPTHPYTKQTPDLCARLNDMTVGIKTAANYLQRKCVCTCLFQIIFCAARAIPAHCPSLPAVDLVVL